MKFSNEFFSLRKKNNLHYFEGSGIAERSECLLSAEEVLGLNPQATSLQFHFDRRGMNQDEEED